MCYRQRENSCGTHSLCLVCHLISGARTPTAADWHARVDELYPSLQFKTDGDDAKLEPRYVGNDPRAVIGVREELIAQKNTNPKRVADWFNASEHASRWRASICLSPAAHRELIVNDALRSKFGVAMNLLSNYYDASIERRDAFEVLARAVPGTAYASITCAVLQVDTVISFTGQLHTITIRKSPDTKLVVHDSNQPAFDTWVEVGRGPRAPFGRALMPTPGSFDQVYTGLSVLFERQ